MSNTTTDHLTACGEALGLVLDGLGTCWVDKHTGAVRVLISRQPGRWEGVGLGGGTFATPLEVMEAYARQRGVTLPPAPNDAPAPRNSREFRDGRTYAYGDDGDCLFSLPGDVPTEVVREVEKLREKAYQRGKAVGRAQKAAEIRRALDEGREG